MPKRTYYPSRQFDDALQAFLELSKKNNWNFIDVKQLEKDALEQRVERAKHRAIENEYLSAHEEFGVGQERRYQRFAAALFAARGAYRNDKAVTAALNPFKRVRNARTSNGSGASPARSPVDE